MNKNEGQQDFQSLYRALYADIYRFIFGMTGNGAEAEDLTQETFLKLFQHLRRNGGLTNHKAWTYRVATNLTCNLLKRRTIFRKLLERQRMSHVDHNDAERQCIKAQEVKQVRAALDNLSLRDRSILMLYQENLSYNEIASALGIKPSSVGKILSRARRRLTKRLQQGEHHEMSK
jgi:RNA polymerase sigma-70 factor (ECF subfamily)